MALDENELRTYKNKRETTEVHMLSFVKDLMAFLVLGGFSVGALTWVDIGSQLV